MSVGGRVGVGKSLAEVGVLVGGTGVGVSGIGVDVGAAVAVGKGVGVTVAVEVAVGIVVGLTVGVNVGAAATRRVGRAVGAGASAALLKKNHRPRPEPTAVKLVTKHKPTKRMMPPINKILRCFCFNLAVSLAYNVPRLYYTPAIEPINPLQSHRI